ncbi:hypothetical protein REPUB_Repub20aG0137600 [Reevesia pubescens]
MEPNHNKIMLVFLLFCIILFNPAQAICVPRNQSDPRLSSPHFSSPKLQPSPSHSSTPISKPPPTPPAPRTASVPATPPKSQPPPSPPAPITASASVSDPRIKALCGKTDEPALCLATISPVFNGKTDIPSVAEMLINAATDQTKQAIATATKMATDPKYSDPKTVSGFNDCKEIYDDALDNMQEALDAIADNDVGTVATMLSAAISDYGTCDDGFTGQPDPNPQGVSPMAKINENLINITGVILAITNMMP